MYIEILSGNQLSCVDLWTAGGINNFKLIYILYLISLHYKPETWYNFLSILNRDKKFKIPIYTTCQLRNSESEKVVNLTIFLRSVKLPPIFF